MTMQKIEAQSPEAQSANIVADNIAKLRAMFPELLTETGGTAAINVDVLKRTNRKYCICTGMLYDPEEHLPVKLPVAVLERIRKIDRSTMDNRE